MWQCKIPTIQFVPKRRGAAEFIVRYEALSLKAGRSVAWLTAKVQCLDIVCRATY
jgi:hypothetical protein